MSSQEIENAIHSLYQAYANDIYRYARLTLHDDALAKDVVQEVFLRAFRSWGKFRGDANAKTWLMTIARNHMTDLLRKKRTQHFIVADYAEAEMIADKSSPAVETKMILQDALSRLKDRYREVFVLRHVDSYSVEETAQILGISKGNVRTTDRRAIAKMREILGVENQEVIRS